jgi:hypothetical protein
MGYALRATAASQRTVREKSAGYETTDDDDELYVLGERCAQAYMEADSLQYRAMKLLAEFHRREGWRDTGFSSTAEWLAWRIGIMPGAARERVRTALALEQLPETSRAMETGELSFAKVRALTRVATPTSEGALLEFARAGSAANLERVVRSWKHLDRKSEVSSTTTGWWSCGGAWTPRQERSSCVRWSRPKTCCSGRAVGAMAAETAPAVVTMPGSTARPTPSPNSAGPTRPGSWQSGLSPPDSPRRP